MAPDVKPKKRFWSHELDSVKGGKEKYRYQKSYKKNIVHVCTASVEKSLLTYQYAHTMLMRNDIINNTILMINDMYIRMFLISVIIICNLLLILFRTTVAAVIGNRGSIDWNSISNKKQSTSKIYSIKINE